MRALAMALSCLALSCAVPSSGRERPPPRLAPSRLGGDMLPASVPDPPESLPRAPRPPVSLADAPPPALEMAGALASPSGPADSAAESWEFAVRPYVWAPRLSGSVTTKGSTTKLDIGIDTVVKDLDIAFMGLLEARKGDAFLLFDTLYAQIQDDAGLPEPKARLDITTRMAMAEAYTGVHLVEQDELQVDALAGLRYWYFYTKLDPRGFSGTVSTTSGSADWVDPVIGARTIAGLGDQWTLNMTADYGGFGVGSASDSTYQIAAVAEHRTESSLSYGFGWRYIVFHRSQGRGANEDAQDIRLSGPIVGLGFRF